MNNITKNSPLCASAGDSALFSSTVVENLFIQEFMLDAPGDFVKVYLFGLMHCQHPKTSEAKIEKFAMSLQMEADRVTKAFRYWRNKGLLRESNGSYEYLNVRSAMFENKAASSEERLSDHTALSNRLAEVSGRREFTPAEYTLLYDLVDIDNFEEEAVALLVQYGISAFGRKFTKSRLETIIREWKQENCNTEKKAQAFVMSRILKKSPANKILPKLGILHRNVSEPEHKLYSKWTEEWNFSHDAILQACDGMTGVQNPNFRYLDKRLSTLYEKQHLSAHQIASAELEKQDFDSKVQRCMFRLGRTGIVTDSHRQYYKVWTESYGMDEDAILLICDDANSSGNGTFKGAESLISSLSRQGIHSADAVLKEREIAKQSAEVLAEIGINKPFPSQSDKAFVQEALQKFPMDMLLLAATYSAGTKRPLGYMKSILKNWEARGISSLKAAEIEHQEHSNTYKNAQNQQLSPLHYEGEHVYKEGELDHLFEDLSDY